MQESHPPVTHSTDIRGAPLHDDIAQCARDLWVQYGQPVDRDQAIWLEAEQRLLSATEALHGESPGPALSSGGPEASQAHTPVCLI